MKIRRLKLHKHPFLGDVEIDFTNSKNESVETIIIAGENGTGKSVILDILSHLSNFSVENLLRDEKREVEIEFSQPMIEILLSHKNTQNLFKDGIGSPVMTLAWDYSLRDWNQLNVVYTDSKGIQEAVQGHIFANTYVVPKYCKRIYQGAEMNFIPRAITSVTAQDIDQNVNSSDGLIKPQADVATEIAQLLVDISSIDDHDLKNWVLKNAGEAPPNRVVDMRMKRFKSAFKMIFPAKNLIDIKTEEGQKKVLFKEKENIMAIGELSSGEKQIVFKGGFLLRNQVDNDNTLFLIDEPEISLHPDWQLKILDYYKKIIGLGSKSALNSQLIVSTHSPFVIHNHRRERDKVVVLNKNKKGAIIVAKSPSYYTWGNEEIVQKAFNISLPKTQKLINIYVEGPTDEKYFKKAIELFEPLLFDDLSVNWVGRVNEKGNHEFTGDSALNQLWNALKANPTLASGSTVLIFDCDTKKQKKKLKKMSSLTFEKNVENKFYGRGIENMLQLPVGFNPKSFQKKTIDKVDDYGASHIKWELDKTLLCDHFCTIYDEKKSKAVLQPIYKQLRLWLDEITN